MLQGGQLPLKKKMFFFLLIWGNFFANLGTSCIPYTVQRCEKHVIERPDNASKKGHLARPRQCFRDMSNGQGDKTFGHEKNVGGMTDFVWSQGHSGLVGA
jgi:hypothetical protein